MKKLLLLLAICVACFSFLNAQSTNGMLFTDAFDWKNVIEKAKTENKYIFVDCYTSWCSPCKQMADNVFTKAEVGNFFNANYINVKLQMDTTQNDLPDIKKQYAVAAFFQKKYKVKAYPTYLFFNSNGEIISIDGGGYPYNDFIKLGQETMNPQNQYYTQIQNYNAGKRDAFFLKNLTFLAIKAFDEQGVKKYSQAYYKTQQNLLTDSNVLFIYKSTWSVKDTGFTIMINNMNRFKEIIDSNELRSTLKMIVVRSAYEEDWFTGNNWSDSEWNAYEKKLVKNYSSIGYDALFFLKTNSYIHENNWVKYVETINNYISTNKITVTELNDFAWLLFERCDDKSLLKHALNWSEKTFTNQQKVEPGYIDTYANILYKLGMVEEAKKWELKAQNVAISQGANKSWGQDVLDKMNKGEQTW